MPDTTDVVEAVSVATALESVALDRATVAAVAAVLIAARLLRRRGCRADRRAPGR
ncbi:MAG TPA: hypothetical protein VFN21_11440 [Acidimicrobiales bacterium]|nr:hypothetical protein [Acidimicrobiales bacterium]